MNEMLKESFDNFSMHTLFHTIYTNAKTCVLKIYFPDNIVKTVYFSEGNIVFAASNAEKDKLVNILLKYKKINQEQLDIVLKQMDKNISLGRNLVNMGFITHKELIWAVKVQIVGIIHSIIIFEDGEYSMIEGALPDGVINLPLNTLKIIFDSLVMFKDREWIARQINAPDAVYKKTILFEEGKSKLLSNDELQKIAESIDGEKALNEIAGISNIEDFKTFKLIYALKFLNLIEEKIDEVHAAEDLFEIEDEPEENIEFAKNFTAKVRDEEDDLEEDFDIEELNQNEKPDKEEDVFIEFDIEENSSIEISDSGDEHQQDDESDEIDVEEKEEDEDEKDEIKLTEEDLDSVIIDEEGTSFLNNQNNRSILDTNPDDEATQQIENAEEIVSEINSKYNKKNEPEKTVITGSLEDLLNSNHVDANDTVEDEIDISLVKDKTSHGLLYSLIFILITIILGFSYYKFYYSQGIIIPGQSIINQVKTEKTVTVEKKPDITENTIGDLNKNNEIIQNDVNLDNSADIKEEIETNQLKEENQNSIVSEDSENSNSNSLENESQDTKESKVVPPKTGKVETDDLSKEDNIDGLSSDNKIEEKDIDVDVSEFSIENLISNANLNFLNNPKSFTIRIEIACMDETIKTAFEKAEEKNKLFLIPKQFKNGTCYFVCYGVFETNAEAISELNRLHEIFFEGGNKPFVTPVTQLIRYIK